MSEPTNVTTETGERRQSVLDLVSLAQGFHERAVVLRALSFAVDDMFGGETPSFLIKRAAGSIRQASEAQLSAIAAELRDAAAAAQLQAEHLLGAVVEVVNDGKVPGLDPRFSALVSPATIELEDLDACLVARPKERPAATHPPVVRRTPSV
jgi:hypothetical protein